MKQFIVMVVLVVVLGSSCPPAPPEPLPMNTLTMTNDLFLRSVTSIQLGFSDVPSDDEDDYEFGPNLLENPLPNGQAFQAINLEDGFYFIRIESTPTPGIPGVTIDRCIVWGEISGDINPTVVLSFLPVCTS